MSTQSVIRRLFTWGNCLFNRCLTVLSFRPRMGRNGKAARQTHRLICPTPLLRLTMKSRSCVFAIAILLGCQRAIVTFEIQRGRFTDPQIRSNPSTMTQFKKTITTIFWVGEGATEENAYIHNRSSYWDDNWMKHYGGVDSPLNRKGWLPAAFTRSKILSMSRFLSQRSTGMETSRKSRRRSWFRPECRAADEKSLG